MSTIRLIISILVTLIAATCALYVAPQINPSWIPAMMTICCLAPVVSILWALYSSAEPEPSETCWAYRHQPTWEESLSDTLASESMFDTVRPVR